MVNEDFSLLEKTYAAQVADFRESAKKAGWDDAKINKIIQTQRLIGFFTPQPETRNSQRIPPNSQQFGGGFRKWLQRPDKTHSQDVAAKGGEGAVADRRGKRG